MPARQSMTTKTKVKIIGAVILAILALILILQNRASVTTQILFVEVTMPRAVLLLLTLIIGVVIGLLIAVSISRRS